MGLYWYFVSQALEQPILLLHSTKEDTNHGNLDTRREYHTTVASKSTRKLT